MEEFLDEWNDYALTGQLIDRRFGNEFEGRTVEGGGVEGGAFEYVVYVYSPGGFLFAQRLKAAAGYLEAHGLDLKASAYRVAGLLQEHAIDQVKQRIRGNDFEANGEYEMELVLESQA